MTKQKAAITLFLLSLFLFSIAFIQSNSPQSFVSCNALFYIPIPAFGFRAELGALLAREAPWGAGVELGVQRGEFARSILHQWTNCSRYVLVDMWAPLESYYDIANVEPAEQNANQLATMANVAPFLSIISVCRNFTTSCALKFNDETFDFVFVDARHDRPGVLEDLETWWPKARRDALFCGHDFVTQAEGPAQTNQRWDIDSRGNVDLTGGAVRAAVEGFANLKRRQLQISYKEPGWWTWCMRK